MGSTPLGSGTTVRHEGASEAVGTSATGKAALVGGDAEVSYKSCARIHTIRTVVGEKGSARRGVPSATPVSLSSQALGASVW
jgi:hypothetical protein